MPEAFALCDVTIQLGVESLLGNGALRSCNELACQLELPRFAKEIHESEGWLSMESAGENFMFGSEMNCCWEVTKEGNV